ncbi:MAG: type II secretion system GspH family protein [Bifidobacteriaceae bacterium]|nr:type II secretion system GspH family protein [Bifidobacteriaceae bacterium]
MDPASGARRPHAPDGGFSLVELLIVIIIMGVLAAIAIPLYMSQRSRAEDTRTRTDVVAVGKELAAYWAQDDAAPPTIVQASGFPTASDRSWHLFDAGVTPTTVTAANFDETVIAAVNPNVAPTGTRGTDWDFSGTSKTDWCFWAYNSEGRDGGFWVTATSPVQGTGGSALNQCNP